MTKLYDILDWASLQGHIQRKEITERFHPEFPNLVIYNYADVVAFSGNWTHETMATRGLIVDLETMDVLARPFKKFFNYGQVEAGKVDLDAPLFSVDNKFDGSLGIAYMQPDGLLAVATRGSFESDQAKHATKVLHDNWGQLTEAINLIKGGFTPLYEIIYPENRIVVDYGTTDSLVFLGTVSNESGAFVPLHSAPEEGFETLRSVLAQPDRSNAEGYVVWTNPFKAVKLKYAAYVELHRIVTGLNRKSIWRALSEGYDVYLKLMEQLPDELYVWAGNVGTELQNQYSDIIGAADEFFLRAVDYMEDTSDDDWYQDFDRKKFAEWVAANVPSEYRGYVFALVDNKDIQTKIWKQIEPIGGER